ncbi:sulfite exporter TauE/SafE family protein [soil metagenome]
MQLLAVLAAILVGALLKGITGMGLPPIVLPVLAGVVGAQEAVIILAVPTSVTNAWLAWRHRAHASGTRNLKPILVSGAAGSLLGAWLLTSMDDRLLSVLLATIVLVYAAVVLRRPEASLSPTAIRSTAAPVGLVAGALQGATGLSGPVLATYLHAFRLRPPAYVLSISLLFGVFGAVQAVGLIALGRLTGRLALEGLAATAVAMAVLPVGVRLGTRLSRREFDRVVLAVLVLSSVKLLVDALA